MQQFSKPITRQSVLNLYNSSLGNFSPHSIGQWLKVQTDDEYIVIPRKTASSIASLIEELDDLKMYL